MHINSPLNSELLASLIKEKRGDKPLRVAAKEISKIGKMSPATLSRIEGGKLPDVETFITICSWLNVHADYFITEGKAPLPKLSEKENLVYQLRSSKILDDDTVNAMITMVELAFNRKKNAR